MDEKLMNGIEAKYRALGENPETYLKGLLHAKPVNYWDYIETDTLLSLQRPRTDFKDEEIFIMYHQVTELFLKMILHEIRQLVFEDLDEAGWIDKIARINRYTGMLISSFDIMKSGMNYDDYNLFRNTLAPASGFQSVQFRYIELHCTRLSNLVNKEGRKRLGENPSVEELFENSYWKDAGFDRATGKKTSTLRQFENKYLDTLAALARKVQGVTLEEKVSRLENPAPALVEQLKAFDYAYNVKWPAVHLETARHYLDKRGENQAATGGSEWKKYLHPRSQQRMFFPLLWNSDEIGNWGNELKEN